MNIQEFNEILYDNYGENANLVFIDMIPSVYPEIEKLYLDVEYVLDYSKFEKEDIANFYQKFDYIGIRNAQEIVNNYPKFKNEIVYGDTEEKKISISPSQFEFLKLIGWNVKQMENSKIKIDHAWHA